MVLVHRFQADPQMRPDYFAYVSFERLAHASKPYLSFRELTKSTYFFCASSAEVPAFTSFCHALYFALPCAGIKMLNQDETIREQSGRLLTFKSNAPGFEAEEKSSPVPILKRAYSCKAHLLAPGSAYYLRPGKQIPGEVHRYWVWLSGLCSPPWPS